MNIKKAVTYNEHTFSSSSQTDFVFFRFVIPFSLAYFSHLVNCFSLGTGFSLGSLVVGAGSLITTSLSTRVVGS